MDNAQAAADVIDKKKKKRDKVRSAWISFAGRIVAQIVGAIATVALGVMVLHRYTTSDTRPPAAELRHQTSAQSAAAAAPHSHVIVITPAMLGLRDADERLWPADRNCAPTLDIPAASPSHADNRTFLSR